MRHRSPARCAALASALITAVTWTLAGVAQTAGPVEGQATEAPAARNSDSDCPLPTSTIRLGPGDLLELKVFNAPELGSTLRVSSAGEITVALIGSLRVAGLTPEQAQSQIERRFRDGGFLRDPHVSILVKEFASQGISVLGEVAHPGVYALLGTPRLLDAIAVAGGTTPRAGKVVLVMHRSNPNSAEKIPLARDAEQVSTQNIELHPGDTLVVSRAGIVYVSGDVHTPGGFVMDQNENLTVLQAIALAQGLNPTASLSSARIIRREAGALKELPVELKLIMAAKSPDIELKDDDVLFIPNSASKSVARKSLESIVQVATGLAIYRR